MGLDDRIDAVQPRKGVLETHLPTVRAGLAALGVIGSAEKEKPDSLILQAAPELSPEEKEQLAQLAEITDREIETQEAKVRGLQAQSDNFSEFPAWRSEEAIMAQRIVVPKAFNGIVGEAQGMAERHSRALRWEREQLDRLREVKQIIDQGSYEKLKALVVSAPAILQAHKLTWKATQE